jgi:hypothetical protein
MLHETPRKSRCVGSSSPDCSPASGAREHVDGSGCGGWSERVVREAVEGCGGARRPIRLGQQDSSRARAKVDGRGPQTIAGRVVCRGGVLGFPHVRMELPARKDADRAAIRRKLSRRLRRDAFAPNRVERSEASASCPRAGRTSNRRMAPSRVASAKKRGPIEKLA